MNISCEIIRDLLPLYHDGVCSNDSKSLVVAHLKSCEVCRKELDLLDTDLMMPHVEPDKEKSIKAVSTAWKRAKKRSFVKGTFLAALICAILIGGFIGLTQWKIIPVPTDVLEVSELSQLPDGSICFNLFVNDNKNLYFTKYNRMDDGCFYVTPMRSVIETTRKYDIGGFDKFHVFNPSGYNAEPMYIGTVSLENVIKIYVGPVGEGTLVWEEGMELPAASKDIEQMLARN